MTEHLESIRYVTSHFRELQGLRIIPIGLLPLAAFFGNAEWTPWSDFIVGDWGTGAYLLIAGLVLLYLSIASYYRLRFGTIERTAVPIKASVVFWASFVVALLLDAFQFLPVSFTWLVIAAGVSYGVLDGSRRYGHLLLGAGVALFAFMPLLTGVVGNVYLTGAMGALGGGFILVGIHDHIILVRTLGEIQRQQQHG